MFTDTLQLIYFLVPSYNSFAGQSLLFKHLGPSKFLIFIWSVQELFLAFILIYVRDCHFLNIQAYRVNFLLKASYRSGILNKDGSLTQILASIPFQANKFAAKQKWCIYMLFPF